MTPATGERPGPSAGPVDDRPWHYTDVECARCGVHVHVTKFSLQHTSVQWTGGAVLQCAEFAVRVAAGGDSALIPTCASLRDSIDRAVACGRVRVGLDGGDGSSGQEPPP